MFHNDRNDVITSDDITDVAGIHVGEENGQKVATLKVLLDPRKDFLAIKEFFLHLTDGVNHRMIGPVTASESPIDVIAHPEPVAVPAAETPSTTAEVAGTSEETVKSPAVTPTKETSTKGEK